MFVKVQDAADTLVVQNQDRTADLIVRLEGIRAPQVGEPWWAVCSTRLGNHLRGRDLVVRVNGAAPGADGAVPGKVFADRGRVDVAARLVRSGCARTAPGADRWLAIQEGAARQERRGIWADPR